MTSPVRLIKSCKTGVFEVCNKMISQNSSGSFVTLGLQEQKRGLLVQFPICKEIFFICLYLKVLKRKC